ncbi:MAG: hypothetical protein E7434_01605 [Ruminococcaceae bacterium]|nr:hypothetical protein [Oscillospiraceae bacterium]
MRTKETASLGSGYCYLVEVAADTSVLAADLVALATDANKIGETSKGATLTYSGDTHEESDDHGLVTRVITTKETVELDLGVFTWGLDTLKNLASTARIEKEGDYDVLKIGGLGKDNGKRYVVIFKQVDAELGDLYVAMIATNTAGLALAFARDNVTKLQPKFRALPCDKEGTLVKMFEALPTAA